MPKINLLNNIRKKQNRKRNPNQNSVWLIVTEQNDKEYFVQRAEEGNIVFWTSNLMNAMKFHTEIGCQHFAHAFIKQRKNVHLKWIKDDIEC